jgi:hypothetical protein
MSVERRLVADFPLCSCPLPCPLLDESRYGLGTDQRGKRPGLVRAASGVGRRSGAAVALLRWRPGPAPGGFRRAGSCSSFSRPESGELRGPTCAHVRVRGALIRFTGRGGGSERFGEALCGPVRAVDGSVGPGSPDGSLSAPQGPAGRPNACHPCPVPGVPRAHTREAPVRPGGRDRLAGGPGSGPGSRGEFFIITTRAGVIRRGQGARGSRARKGAPAGALHAGAAGAARVLGGWRA